MRGVLALVEVDIQEGPSLVGVSLADHGKSAGCRISYVALERDGEGTKIPPCGTDVLQTGDRLIVPGDPLQIRQMMAQANATRSARGAA